MRFNKRHSIRKLVLFYGVFAGDSPQSGSQEWPQNEFFSTVTTRIPQPRSGAITPRDFGTPSRQRKALVAPWTPSLPRLRNTRNSISSTQPPTKQLLRQDSKKVLVPFNPDTSDSKNDSDGRYSPQVCIFLSASIALLDFLFFCCCCCCFCCYCCCCS